MIKNIIIIVVMVALIVVVYHFIFESQRANIQNESKALAEVLPGQLQTAYLEKQAEKKQAGEEQIAAEEAAAQAELTATFRGNGIDLLEVQVVNPKTAAESYELKAGTLFQSYNDSVMLVENLNESIEPGATVEYKLKTVPLGLNNQQLEGPYRIIEQTPFQLEPLTDALSTGSNLDEEKLALAAIILFNNPSLSEVADFPVADSGEQAGSSVPVSSRRSAAEVIDALLLLRGLNIETGGLKLATDTQLKLEALVKLDSNESAREFYGLADRRRHWAYWKQLLLTGDPRFRHYSLYGIGRFFPEVAVQMMPNWAANRRITPIYRLSAVYALGLSEKPEALQQLQSLAKRYPAQTNMGRATREAAQYIRGKS